MERLIYYMIGLVVVLLPTKRLNAETGFRHEQQKVRLLTTAIKLYADQHKGALPVELDQIKNYFDLQEALGGETAEMGSFTDRYAIVDRAQTITHEGNRVVLVGTKPIYGHSGDNSSPGGRYLGVITGSGTADVIWVKEDMAQNLISSNNLEIKPIGGKVPAPSVDIDRTARTTEYQKKVMESLGQEIIIASESERPKAKPETTTSGGEAGKTSNSDTPTKTKESRHPNLDQPTTSFPWLLAIVGLILLAVIAVIGFKVLGKSS